MARESGGANNMHPLSWGAQTEKIPHISSEKGGLPHRLRTGGRNPFYVG